MDRPRVQILITLSISHKRERDAPRGRAENARINIIANRPINSEIRARSRDCSPRASLGRSTAGSMRGGVPHAFASRPRSREPHSPEPIGISIGTNSDRELGDSAGFLRRGEKSLNRRSYRRAPLINETPRPPMLRAATRDKDPISTGRSRKGHAAALFFYLPCLRPPANILYQVSSMESREASTAHPRRISFARSIRGIRSILFVRLLSLQCIFFLFPSTSFIPSIFLSYRRSRYFPQLNLRNVCDGRFK